jgi:lipid-A-disaccharide synthase
MPPESCNHNGKKVWILAGESSGDMYGAQLAEELRLLDSTLSIQGMGGSVMATSGVEILVDSTELGVVGFVEVLKHLPVFRAIFAQLVNQADAERPDVVVLIDYPGFNIRFARKMKKLGIPVVYYVSPQVWAWGKRRIPELANLCVRMLVIFPFEEAVYANVDLDTRFVGHPLVRILHEQCPERTERDEKLILLLPGSRFSEVDRLTVPLLETAVAMHAKNPSYRYVVAAPRAAVGERIAASGTVTMQAAILGLPLVVVYRLNPLTYWLGKRLIDVPYITMANLVIDEALFEEFIQGDVQPSLLCAALQRILPGGDRRDEVVAGMDRVIAALGGAGNASKTAAEAVLEITKDT